MLSTKQIVFTRQAQSLALYRGNILPSTTVVMWWREMAPEGGIRGLLARGLRCAILPLPVSVSVPLLRLSGHLSILLSNCPCKNFQAGQHLSSVCYHHLQVPPLTLDHIQSGHWSPNLLSNCQCQSLVDYHKEPHCRSTILAASQVLLCIVVQVTQIWWHFWEWREKKAKRSYLRDRNIYI